MPPIKWQSPCSLFLNLANHWTVSTNRVCGKWHWLTLRLNHKNAIHLPFAVLGHSHLSVRKPTLAHRERLHDEATCRCSGWQSSWGSNQQPALTTKHMSEDDMGMKMPSDDFKSNDVESSSPLKFSQWGSQTLWRKYHPSVLFPVRISNSLDLWI